MRRFLPAVIVAGWAVCLSGLAVPAAKPEPGPPTQEELAGGQALAERLRSSAPAEGSDTHGKLIIKSGGVTREVPISCQVIIHADNWETDYQTGATSEIGPERLVVIHNTNGPNQYMFARAASPSTPLPALSAVPAVNANVALAGSDFSLTDLGLEFLHWPVQRQLHGEMRLGQPCYVLESRNPQAEGYVRVRSDIDKDSGGLLIAYAYDADGKLVKEFSLHGSSFKKVNGRWQVEKMDIRTKKTGSHTELKFDLNK